MSAVYVRNWQRFLLLKFIIYLYDRFKMVCHEAKVTNLVSKVFSTWTCVWSGYWKFLI